MLEGAREYYKIHLVGLQIKILPHNVSQVEKQCSHIQHLTLHISLLKIDIEIFVVKQNSQYNKTWILSMNISDKSKSYQHATLYKSEI